MEWFLLAALVSTFAKIGLQGVDSTVGTAAQAIVIMLFVVIFVISIGKGPQLIQFTSKEWDS